MPMGYVIYALGFFDGVHIGHAALLSACHSLAQEHECAAGVVTFGAHPDGLVLGNAPSLINTPEDRERLLKRDFLMDTVVTLPFDEEMRTMPWEAFLRMLRKDHGAVGFVCGDDFRFGFKGQGNAEILEQYCRAEGLPCAVVPEMKLGETTVSSTHIRSLLEAGDMEKANRFLGHPHILTGEVREGRKLGRTLGIPTANLWIPEGVMVPRYGVYACRAILGNAQYLAVTNIGSRPTVGGHRVTVEPWLLDFSGDLYGKELTLQLHTFLRPERKFESLEELRQEIQKNAAQTREFFGKI